LNDGDECNEIINNIVELCNEYGTIINISIFRCDLSAEITLIPFNSYVQIQFEEFESVQATIRGFQGMTLGGSRIYAFTQEQATKQKITADSSHSIPASEITTTSASSITSASTSHQQHLQHILYLDLYLDHFLTEDDVNDEDQLHESLADIGRLCERFYKKQNTNYHHSPPPPYTITYEQQEERNNKQQQLQQQQRCLIHYQQYQQSLWEESQSRRKKNYNKKKKNKPRLEVIISEISSLLFKTLHPYIIGVVVMLIILFIMNLMQF
jgi:hypothetical protein